MNNVVPLKRANDDLMLKFSVQQGESMSAIRNVQWTWTAFRGRLEKSHADSLTLEQFRARSVVEQTSRKRSNGYYIGAQFKSRTRHRAKMLDRQMLTLDLDNATPEVLKRLLTGTTGLGETEYYVHSTRTHGGDKIKLRVIIPLAAQLPMTQFPPLSRLTAALVDPTMASIDPVSHHPTQIMYWPAHCADVKPVAHHQRGSLLAVEAILAKWDGDYRSLPVSPQEGSRAREQGLTKQAPGDKRGIIGAFCREIDLHDGIARFLEDEYAPSETDANGVPSRYTFLPGTGYNGCIVFPDGYFQSYHGTDPAYNRNVHIFDLIMIHKFGHLDTNTPDDTKPTERPSYKAMKKWVAENVPEVMEEMARDALESADSDHWLDANATEVTSSNDDDTEWMGELDLGENGLPKSNLPNLILILTHAKVFKGLLGYNEFTQMECLMRRLRVAPLGINIKVGADGYRMVEDSHVNMIRHILEARRGKGLPGWGLRVADRDLEAAIDGVCAAHPFHPIRDWLDWLPIWDKTPRLGAMFVRACGAADTPYHRAVARLALVASVARVYEPGIKFDHMVVLIGPQGIRKTTMVHTLGGLWTGETEGHFDNKQKFVEASAGKWFLEMGEMVHFRRASDEEAIKTMLSGTVDTVRLSYDRRVKDYPRQFVIWGTTNDDKFLRDYHRRIWPIQCVGVIDIEWLEANRDQLFAEAVETYRALRAEKPRGILPLDLPPDARPGFMEAQEAHRTVSEAEITAGMIRQWLDQPVVTDKFEEETRRDITCIPEICQGALGTDPKLLVGNRRLSNAISEAMKHLRPEWMPGKSARFETGVHMAYRRVET